MTENNEPSKSRARTTVPEGSIDIHEYIDGKNFVPEPNIKTEVGQKGVIRATCISKRKGTRKEPIPEGVEVVAHFGVKKRCTRLERLASPSLTSCVGIH